MVKRLIFMSVVALSCLNAQEISSELKAEIDTLEIENSPEFIKNFSLVLDKIPSEIEIYGLTDIKNSMFLMGNIREKGDEKMQNIPILISKDGKSLFGLTGLFISNDEIESAIREKFYKDTTFESDDTIAKNKLLEISKVIPNEYAVEFINPNSSKVAIILSDPECPFCRDHLREVLPNLIKEMSAKIYFTPVHPESAYIKSMIILEETKDKSNSEKLEILEKVYSENYKIDFSLDINTDKLRAYRDMIFEETEITGVPTAYIYDNSQIKE